MKHPHAEILQAIAEDADTEIEYWNGTANEWRKTSIALVLASDRYEQYRIKPKPRLATAPVWDEASEAMLHLNSIESILGGANGPTIRLRAILNNKPILATRLRHLSAENAAPRDCIDEAADVIEATNALLHQIDIGDFVDSNGHSAKMLKPVHDLMRLLSKSVETERNPELAAAARAALEKVTESNTPRFQTTFCSSCGGEFGPGDHGFSHCENHANLRQIS